MLPCCWLVIPRTGAFSYWRPIIGLRMQQQLMPGQPWQVEVHVIKSLHNLHLCHHSHFVHGPTGKWPGKRWLGKKGWLFTKWVVLTMSISSNAETIFWWALTWDRRVHLESFIYIVLLRMPFSPIFLSCPFQVSDHPAKPLASVHESVNSQISGHLYVTSKM